MATMSTATPPIEVFFSYAPEDRELRDQLITHLALLARDGIIQGFHDEEIRPGEDWQTAVESHLDRAGVILLLISADYTASDACFEFQMKRALARHDQGEAIVIPVLLRPCAWEKAPFARLHMLPSNKVPVTRWANRDEAFTHIAHGLSAAITGSAPSAPTALPPEAPRKQSPLALAIAAFGLLLVGLAVGLRVFSNPRQDAAPTSIAPLAPSSSGATAPTSASAEGTPPAYVDHDSGPGVHPVVAPQASGVGAADLGTATAPQSEATVTPGQTKVRTGDLTIGHESEIRVANRKSGGEVDAKTGVIKGGDKSRVSIANVSGAAGQDAGAAINVETKGVTVGDKSRIDIGNQEP